MRINDHAAIKYKPYLICIRNEQEVVAGISLCYYDVIIM
jgi:hypothetical protein